MGKNAFFGQRFFFYFFVCLTVYIHVCLLWALPVFLAQGTNSIFSFYFDQLYVFVFAAVLVFARTTLSTRLFCL